MGVYGIVETVSYKNHVYPALQSKGFAAQFAIPFAKHLCKGYGYDVGCGKMEWKLPGAVAIDPEINSRYNALHFPRTPVDYIFSSHTLEHIPE